MHTGGSGMSCFIREQGSCQSPGGCQPESQLKVSPTGYGQLEHGKD